MSCVGPKLLFYKVLNRKFIRNRNEKKKPTEILIIKLVYVRLSILELSKILTYEFLHDYEKPKYDGLFYIDTLLLYALKQMVFIKILQKILKIDFLFQITN